MNEKDIESFRSKGYLIKKTQDQKSLQYIHDSIFNLILKIRPELKKKINYRSKINFFENLHKFINLKNLNEIRLKIINKINNDDKFSECYYNVSKEMLDMIVGNELAMQMRINLSIQMPKDDSSLLPIHSDVWSGDSPFESVIWLPLVDCYKTKSMFILPPSKYSKIKKLFLKKNSSSSEQIFQKIKKDLHWIKIKYGEVMIFNQCLPHGNTVNLERGTRWSMNCRFKSIFSPYSDKKIGEFFEPITLKPVSELAINYNLPKIS